MPEAKIRVGLDHAGVRTGANEVKAQLDQMKKHAENAHHAVNGGQGTKHHAFGAMVSERKAEKQFSRLGQDLSKAANGSEALGTSLERVGRIFHLGLAIGVGAHLAGYFIEQGNKVHEETEKITSDFDALAATAKDKLDFGTVGDKITFGDQMARQMDILEAQQKKLNHFTPSTVAQIWSGTYTDDVEELAKARGEAQALRQEARQATLEDFELQVKIARMRIEGQGAEADELERTLKLHKDILRIKQSGLDAYAKDEAIKATTELSESGGDLKDAEADRAQRLKDETAINEALKKREHMGETEEQHMARLAKEVGHHADVITTGRYDKGSNQEIAERAELERKITELVGMQITLAKKYNEEQARLTKSATGKREQNADKQFRNSVGDMEDEEKINALLKKRAELAQEHRTANPERKAEIEGSVIDINQEISQIGKHAAKVKTTMFISDLARHGLGGAAVFSKDDRKERIVKLAEDALKIHTDSKQLLIEIKNRPPHWPP